MGPISIKLFLLFQLLFIITQFPPIKCSRSRTNIIRRNDFNQVKASESQVVKNLHDTGESVNLQNLQNPETSKNEDSNPSKPDTTQDSQFMLPICCNSDPKSSPSRSCPNSMGSGQEGVFKRRNWVVPKSFVSSRKVTKFRLISTTLSCKGSTITANFPLHSESNNQLKNRHAYFTLDGYLKYDHEYFRPDEYCISGLNKTRIEVQVCQPNCSDPATPCIQKCCGLHQIYSFGYGDHPRGCVDLDERSSGHSPLWSPSLYHSLDRKLDQEELSSLRPHIIQKFPTTFKSNCRFNKTTVFPHGRNIADFLSSLTHKTFRNLEFKLRKDGWLLYPGDAKFAKNIDNYCIDGAQDYGENFPFSNAEDQTILFLCSGGVDEAFGPSSSSPGPSPTPPPSNEGKTRIIPVRKFSTPPPTTASSFPRRISTFPTSSTPSPSSFLPEEGFLIPQIQLPIPHQFIPISPTIDLSSLHPQESQVPKSVALNSIEEEMSPDSDSSSSEHKPEHFIPATLKMSVKVPISPETETQKPEVDPASSSIENSSETFLSLPACCKFDPYVNDGNTHHCRNRRMSDKASNSNETFTAFTPAKPKWMVPEYFTTRGKTSAFSLSHQPLKCGSGKFQFQGFINNFDQLKAKNPGEKRHGILRDGVLKYDNQFYEKGQYCINGISPKILEVLICKPDCSNAQTPCLRKCCGLDEIYNLGLSSGTRGCQPLKTNESRFNPVLYKSLSLPLKGPELSSISPQFVQNYPPNFQKKCYNGITLAFPFSAEVAEKLSPRKETDKRSFKHLEFRFRKDGKLMYSFPDSDGTSLNSIYDKGEYCVDAVRDYGESEPFRNFENQTILFICASEPHSSEKQA